MNIEPVDMKSLPMSEKAKLATTLGDECGKILNRALNRCNKMLKKFGYSVSMTLNFHELNNDNDINKENKQ